MSAASIQEVASGELKISGVIDFRTGPQLRSDGKRLINNCVAGSLTIDCAEVVKSSSVGLSLLLSFMRDASAAGKSLKIRSLPEDMREIAEVSGLVELLPLQP